MTMTIVIDATRRKKMTREPVFGADARDKGRAFGWVARMAP